MVFMSNNRKKIVICFVSGLLISGISSSYAAIALDRTRVIYPGSEKNMVVNIQNESMDKPYLAQSWLEDAKGNKIIGPISVTPELQRVEPGKKSVIKLSALPATLALPQDRESIFYFNVREIPPKSDRSNILQLALQTKIKLFYRPAGIIPEKFSRQDDKLTLTKISGGYEIENPTPYYITVLGIKGAEKGIIPKDLKPIMIPPKSKETMRSGVFATPFVTTINDFGGKPTLKFNCNGNKCIADTKNK